MSKAHRQYRPSSFIVGYYDSTLKNSYLPANEHVTMRFGYPSCRWLREGKWTNLSTFSRLTKGFKPHSQRDAGKQILKDIGSKIEEISNEPIAGFKILNVHHGYRSNDQYSVIYDPRGFCIVLDSRWLEKAIFKHHCSVSEDGVVSGKWFYVWNCESFGGIVHESELSTIDADDSILEAESSNLKVFTEKDLEVGTVYDLAAENGDKANTKRVVYIGQFEVPNFPSIKTLLNRGFQLSSLARRWNSVLSLKSIPEIDDVEWLPWNCEDHVKKAALATKPKKSQPVFIILEDNIHYQSTESADSRLFWYADDLAKVPASDRELSICFDLNYNGWNDMSSFICGKEFVKRLVKKSDSQVLRIITNDLSWKRTNFSSNFRYTKPEEFKVLKLENLQNAFSTFVKQVDNIITKRLSLACPAKPDDLKGWFDRIWTWKTKEWDPKHKNSYYY